MKKENPNSKKKYLGDSVYVQLDKLYPGAVILTTENGFGAIKNTIYMEFDVIQAFVQYVAKIDKK